MTSEILNNIKILLLDVDGVLTDGGIIYNDKGAETKVFDAQKRWDHILKGFTA